MKRLFDIVCSVVGLIMTAPFFLICAILIKLDSRGSVFFRQVRVGKGGKPFKIFKFRTMVRNAESAGPKITGNNDSRVTSVGSVLRWSKLDELPQLINVLVGNMSFVGPRPEVPEVVNYYTEAQRHVLSVKPGIIGANQILARNESDLYPEGVEDTETYYIKHILPEKLKIDLDYVKKSSFRYDLNLLFVGIVTTILGAAQARIFLEAKIPAFLLPIDMVLVGLAYFFAYLLRFDWHIPPDDKRIFALSLPIVMLTRITIFFILRIYKNIWKYVGISDVFLIVKACTFSSVISVVLIFFLGIRVFSRSVFLIDWILVMLFVGGLRVMLRIMTERISFRERFKNMSVERRNILIVGAGDVGEMALRELARNVKYRYNAVGFIDDDPQKFGKRIHGIKVLGPISDIPSLAKPYRVDEAFLAISRLSSSAVKSIVNSCEEAGIKCRIVPAVVDALNGKIHLNKIRDIEIADLFGREPVQLDFTSIKKFISNKKVLITGAGGSIGSELCRQVAEYQPNSMVLVDRNENYLHDIQCELERNFKHLPIAFKIADITNKAKMDCIFSSFQPEIVFHAAAQKHVPLSESNPDEAVKNNILGTQVLVRLANKSKTDCFVMVSTDKAVHPTSVMGVTKRVAEMYIQAFSKSSHTRFVTVRFGNVMNSNGSVVPMFIKQIERGGPVTVTHPDIERFFMSIPEAVQLILQAVTMGRNGETFVLDMGQPIKILDLATELIKRAGFTPNKDIKIEFTGLRPGEKLFEELVGKGEQVLLTEHSQLNVLRSESMLRIDRLEKEIDELSNLTKNIAYEKIIEKLHEIVPEYGQMDGTLPERPKRINSRQLMALTTGSQEQSNIMENSGEKKAILTENPFNERIVKEQVLVV